MFYDYEKKLKIEYFGQSHSEKLRVEISGLPSCEKVDLTALKTFLQRRKGGLIGTTKRVEEDDFTVLSGIENGQTTLDKIVIEVANKNVIKTDYEKNKNLIRPSTADYPAYIKYGENYATGGGKFSARLTVLTCIAGGIIKQILENKGIFIKARIVSIGKISDNLCDLTTGEFVSKRNFQNKIDALVKKTEKKGDSLGGKIECVCNGLPVGVGDSDFSGLESKISNSVFSIPSVKAIEFGNGIFSSSTFGSFNNDIPFIDNGVVKTKTNNAGGILGGMSNGMPIVFYTYFKPIPSIQKEQLSVNIEKMCSAKIKIGGRHDVCGVLRATPIVESATAIAIYSCLDNDKENTLKSKREEIDKIDSEIASFLDERKKIVRKIGEIKKQNGIAVLDKNREREIVDRLCKLYPDSVDYISAVYKEIFTVSKDIEND